MCDPVTINSSDTTLVQSITDVIESIALEEVGIANVIAAEACKIEKALDLAESIDDLVKINCSVADTLETLVNSQMLLNFKLKKIACIFDLIER